MRNINEFYNLWSEKCVDDPALIAELSSIKGNDEEILDRFYKNLEFGTAGLRGILGAGTNRMNIYTVCQATQGLCDFLNDTYKNPSVAIAFDSRNNSELFAKQAAGVFAANGIKVHFFSTLVPTPMLSFAVRKLKCQSGIIVTASHNPAAYNGYKCYDPEGYQMTDDAAKKTYEYIQKVDMFDGVKKMEFEDALANGSAMLINAELIEEYYQKVQSCNINPQACKDAGLKVIFTPLNGAGNIPVREILKRVGIDKVSVVAQQELPDGDFPTCPYPNPEIRQAFEYAIKLAQKEGADLLLATDPDCDRMGIAVFDGNDYQLMTGNEVGAMFAQYVLSQYTQKDKMPKNPIVVKSIVTTKLVEEIAKKFGAKTVNLMTGFKYIGELITNLEKEGREDDFVIGMEESYGYLIGTHARDKDAVVASMLVCEMASYYKTQGKTLIDVIDDIYDEYGMYLNKVENFTFEGASGMKAMADIMEDLRANPPLKIANLEVESISDYKDSTNTDIRSGKISKIDLPSSNVLSYSLPNGNGVIVRPSGTEPKIKVYITACAKTRDMAENLYKELASDMKRLMKID
ncbi:MAG: phospho-sugar mutase [Clostridiales bacterium]|nr:phospho-sugar mutase [Clostridiales bacterium]